MEKNLLEKLISTLWDTSDEAFSYVDDLESIYISNMFSEDTREISAISGYLNDICGNQETSDPMNYKLGKLHCLIELANLWLNLKSSEKTVLHLSALEQSAIAHLIENRGSTPSEMVTLGIFGSKQTATNVLTRLRSRRLVGVSREGRAAHYYVTSQGSAAAKEREKILSKINRSASQALVLMENIPNSDLERILELQAYISAKDDDRWLNKAYEQLVIKNNRNRNTESLPKTPSHIKRAYANSRPSQSEAAYTSAALS